MGLPHSVTRHTQRYRWVWYYPRKGQGSRSDMNPPGARPFPRPLGKASRVSAHGPQRVSVPTGVGFATELVSWR